MKAKETQTQTQTEGQARRASLKAVRSVAASISKASNVEARGLNFVCRSFVANIEAGVYSKEQSAFITSTVRAALNLKQDEGAALTHKDFLRFFKRFFPCVDEETGVAVEMKRVCRSDDGKATVYRCEAVARYNFRKVFEMPAVFYSWHRLGLKDRTAYKLGASYIRVAGKRMLERVPDAATAPAVDVATAPAEK